MLKKIFLMLIVVGFFSISISTNAAPAPLFYNLNAQSLTSGSSSDASSGSFWGGYSDEEDNSSNKVAGYFNPQTGKWVTLGIIGAGIIGGIITIAKHRGGGHEEITTVKCWGFNQFGQLGDNTTTNRSSPVSVVGQGGIGKLLGVKQITGGENHTCALLDTGKVECWGDNVNGQLGVDFNLITERYYPDYVIKSQTDNTPFSGAEQITAGREHNCALLNDGKVKCWGNGLDGRLGDNNFVPRYYPDYVIKSQTDNTPFLGAEQITAGGSHTCALLNDGTVKCWGNNYYGQLGDNSNDERRTPVDVVSLSDVKQITAGWHHTCAIISDDGKVKCWGSNEFGQLGDGESYPYQNQKIPVDVLETGGSGMLSGVRQITGGGFHTCALLNTGHVVCWGRNDTGQLGDNKVSGDKSSVPVNVLGLGGAGLLSGVIQIMAGEYHTCALLNTGHVVCWGKNDTGQLGDGTTNEKDIPVDTGKGTLSGVIQLFVGDKGSHTCALVRG